MDFRIRNLARAGGWLGRLSDVLHDAWIDTDFQWSETSRLFEVRIERIAYESPSRDWRFLKSYPYVAARLEASPVRSLEVIPREGAIETEWGDQLLELTLDGDGRLVLLRELGETRLLLGSQPTLAVVDSGEPATHSSSIDIGGLDPTELVEVIETSEI